VAFGGTVSGLSLASALRRGDHVIDAILIGIVVVTALILIVFILLHAGRGGGLSDMFGGGSLGGSMAGSTVVEKNLDRLTVITATIFVFSVILLGLNLQP
jgi:preprotein translocase subunit SecG